MAAFHVRQPSIDDTPTRPSSAAASFSSNLTSLKPPRTHQQKPSLSGMTSRAGAGLAAIDLNRLDARANHPRPTSRASATAVSSLKASDLDGLLDNDPHNVGPIEADNTELARRRAEASFQREMEDLRNAALSPSSASDVSLGRKQPSAGAGGARSRQFDDETASSHSRTSASSYESLRIGLAGTAPMAPAHSASVERRQDARDHDDDDLTYVTLPRSEMTSPARTATPGRPAPATAASQVNNLANRSALPSTTNLFASPRPFVASAGANLSAARPAAFSPAPAPTADQRPQSQQQTFSASPRPRTAAAAAADENAVPSRPSPQAAKPVGQSQPFLPSRASPFAGAHPTLSSFRSTGTPHTAPPHRPSPLGRNSPILAASPSATSTPAHSRSFTSRHTSAHGFADRTTMTALPDRTGITDFLRSPERERQILERERRAAGDSANRTSPQQLGHSSAKTSESNLAAQALAGLTAKLATLERDNIASAARVAELEARLAASRGAEQSQNQSRQQEEEARRVRREVEILLGDERARREDLERVVSSLRAQNAHLDATLSAQKQTLDALRVSRSAAPAAAATTTGHEPYALKSEVQDLKHALAALGYEVDGVRTVVEELLREKEERDANKKWEAEEAERRADLQAQREGQVPFASDGSVGTPDDHVEYRHAEDSVRSWVSREEVEMLKREQREEEQRRKRSAAAADPSKTTAARPRQAQAEVSFATSQDPTYLPSATASSVEASEASFVSVTSATNDSLSSASTVDEPDFARAERIFASAPAAHRERRKTRQTSADGPDKRRVDRVVLLEEPSANLCTNCHGRKDSLRKGSASRHSASKGGRHHSRDDGAEADEEDLAPVDEARERRKREHKAEKARREKAHVEREARKEAEGKLREREEHRRTLEDVLDRLEEEFAIQKKIYLELTAEYQSMGSRSQTSKRRALASHLKKSIDVLEDKARGVKRYADALEDMYAAVHDKTCPQRSLHAVI